MSAIAVDNSLDEHEKHEILGGDDKDQHCRDATTQAELTSTRNNADRSIGCQHCARLHADIRESVNEFGDRLNKFLQRLERLIFGSGTGGRCFLDDDDDIGGGGIFGVGHGSIAAQSVEKFAEALSATRKHSDERSAQIRENGEIVSSAAAIAKNNAMAAMDSSSSRRRARKTTAMSSYSASNAAGTYDWHCILLSWRSSTPLF